MEGVSATIHKTIKSYWKRRGYHRLTKAPSHHKTSRSAELGNSNPNRKQRFWKKIKIKPRPKLKLKISPKKLLIGLRDAYVRMMMRIATTSVVQSGGMTVGMYGGYAPSEFGLRRMKEYDEKMIIEMYKSLAMAKGLVPRDPAKLAAQISCTR